MHGEGGSGSLDPERREAVRSEGRVNVGVERPSLALLAGVCPGEKRPVSQTNERKHVGVTRGIVYHSK